MRKFDFGKAVQNINSLEKQSNADSRFYRPKLVDGKFSSIIRFLPPPEGEDIFFFRRYSHFFEENAMKFIEDCPSTFGLKCPVCEYNFKHYKSTYGDLEKKRIRREKIVMNILVVRDDQNKDREGKVFLYEVGTKIFEKIKNKITPSDVDEPAVDILDYMNGRNFKLKIKTVAGFPNYDDSEFSSEPTPIFGGDVKKIEVVDKNLFSITKIESETKSNIKDYDVLCKRFGEVTGVSLNGNKVDSKNVPQKVETVKVETMESKVEKALSETKIVEKSKANDDDDFASFMNDMD